MSAPKKKNPLGLNLSTLILIGLALGVCVGLFLGELAAGLRFVGQAYVGLLQMSILPYMVVSLIGGIGGLDYERAKRLAVTGGTVLVASWVLAFTVVFIMPLAFPASNVGSFYTPTLVQTVQVDFIDLYVPANPFSSLARTVIPAVAVFSVLVGVALIGIEPAKKRSLLGVLGAMSEALTRVASFVVRLTPIGVFGIAANAAGTMTIEEFGRLQTYIWTFVVATLVLTFWVLPALVATLTPFSYRDTLRASRDALVTGFVTGNLFIVLPILIENAKTLLEEYRLKTPDNENYVDVLIPSSFNFPNIGKLLTLLFVLFAGWFTGNELDLDDYPRFSMVGLFTLFGGVDLALPFLLDQFRIPSDMYQLYVVTGVVNGWFATLIAVMNLFSFTLVATIAMAGSLKFNGLRLIRYLGVTAIVLLCAIGLVRYALSKMVSEADVQRGTLMQMEVTNPAPATVHREASEATERADVGESTLAAILEGGVLRVGYNADNLPSTFFNDKSQLVGFDIELAHRLATDLNVSLEFIPWQYDTLVQQLQAGQFDILAGGMIVNTQRLTWASFSEPYLTVTVAFVVPDYRRRSFESFAAVNGTRGLRIGITSGSLAADVSELIPDTEVVTIDTYREFFEKNVHELDAISISAEAGSAWTVLYPAYAVVVPEPHYSRPVAFGMQKGRRDLLEFVNNWLRLKKTDRTIETLYDTWVLGKVDKQRKRRWSIIRDILGWLE